MSVPEHNSVVPKLPSKASPTPQDLALALTVADVNFLKAMRISLEMEKGK